MKDAVHIADEIHFILECYALSCIRQKYLEPRVCERQNTFEFCELLSTLKLNKLKKLLYMKCPP